MLHHPHGYVPVLVSEHVPARPLTIRTALKAQDSPTEVFDHLRGLWTIRFPCGQRTTVLHFSPSFSCFVSRDSSSGVSPAEAHPKTKTEQARTHRHRQRPPSRPTHLLSMTQCMCHYLPPQRSHEHLAETSSSFKTPLGVNSHISRPHVLPSTVSARRFPFRLTSRREISGSGSSHSGTTLRRIKRM